MIAAWSRDASWLRRNAVVVRPRASLAGRPSVRAHRRDARLTTNSFFSNFHNAAMFRPPRRLRGCMRHG